MLSRVNPSSCGSTLVQIHLDATQGNIWRKQNHLSLLCLCQNLFHTEMCLPTPRPTAAETGISLILMLHVVLRIPSSENTFDILLQYDTALYIQHLKDGPVSYLFIGHISF